MTTLPPIQLPPGPLRRVIPEELARAYDELYQAALEVAGLGYDDGSWMRRLRAAVHRCGELRRQPSEEAHREP